MNVDTGPNDTPAMNDTAAAPLRLIVQDEEDLTVLSALLQDALVRHGDMTYDSRAKRFAMVVSRFRWEGDARERVRTGLHFNHVLKVQHQRIDLGKQDTVAELLSLRGEEEEGGDATIRFDFAGGGSIRLLADCIDAEARDLGESWTTRRTPDHSEAE